MKNLITQEDIKNESEQSIKAINDANALIISNQDEMKIATEMLSVANKFGDEIKKRKEDITKPMNSALKAVRALFKPLEDNKDKAVLIIKRKMIDYQIKIEEENKKAEEKIEKKVESGYIKPETAIEKLENLPETENKVDSDAGSVTFKTIKKIVIEDERLLPREYLIPDERKIKIVALAKEKLGEDQIPGVKIIEEKTLANSR